MIDEFFDYFGLTAGVLIILGVGILIFLIVALIAERRTRILFPNHKKKRGEGSFLDFDDDDEDEEEE